MTAYSNEECCALISLLELQKDIDKDNKLHERQVYESLIRFTKDEIEILDCKQPIEYHI